MPLRSYGYTIRSLFTPVQQIRTRRTPGTSLRYQNRACRAVRLDFAGFAAMFRATFGKLEPRNAQYYYQTPYRRRTQAHRRGWLTAIQIRTVRMGPLGALFYFPKQKQAQNKPPDNSTIRTETMSDKSHDPNQMTGAAMIVRA